MPLWGTILTVIFSGIVAITSFAIFLRSFRFATKDDIKELRNELKNDIERLNQRIDRHLEGHP